MVVKMIKMVRRGEDDEDDEDSEDDEDFEKSPVCRLRGCDSHQRRSQNDIGDQSSWTAGFDHMT